MKKRIVLLLALVLCLSLCACGKNLTLEDLSDMYIQEDDIRVVFTFEDGTMDVEIIDYVPSSASPSGMVAGRRENFSESYTLEGDNGVIIDGTMYHYEIDEDANRVFFAEKFMDLAKEFIFSYVK